MAAVTIDDQHSLHEFYGPPSERAVKKQMPRLDQHCRAFIALAPFLVVASAAPDGSCDASPRGDTPGFVAVLDDETLLIPDRPGNHRVDTYGNAVDNPHVGLIFLVPGMNETLRVNGTARVVMDPALLDPLASRGKAPQAGLLVTVNEAYLHCGKALIRADLWNPAKQIDRGGFPSLGRILSDQIAGLEVDSAERSVEEGYRTRLY